MIKKSTRRPSAFSGGVAARRPITAGTSITSGARNRQATRKQSRVMGSFAGLTPQQSEFARQIQMNCRKHSSISNDTT